MKILLKNAVIIDKTSKHHQTKKDVLIQDGIIKEIAPTIEPTDAFEEVHKENLHISQGWFDSSVSFGEPGYEERETIENGLKVAASGGFTAVAMNANTFPLADNRGILQYIQTKAKNHAVSLFPVGALTMESKGKDLAELYDMKQGGAISFYDYKKPITNANLLKLALQYTQAFQGLVQSFPLEMSVANKGFVHEGIHSTSLGLKGIPSFAEELQIARDIKILEYTGGKLHIPTISTKNSVELIRNAKAKGLNVSCSVAVFNLMLTDEILNTFDTNYKLLPPLREAEDIQALLEGLIDGTIDGVTSDHNPMDIEHKKMEFDLASYGSIGLEACFGALNQVLDISLTIKVLTNLKKIFGIEGKSIAKNNPANLTLFNPEVSWKFKDSDIISSSKNAALLNQNLRGKVYGIFSNNQLIIS
ncbi:MAG: dihydroorotase [Bacteroidetes bacterium]|jgi:dihydroorotase|nr:dihydroorotase [Bacteroidota bacterium]